MPELMSETTCPTQIVRNVRIWAVYYTESGWRFGKNKKRTRPAACVLNVSTKNKAKLNDRGAFEPILRQVAAPFAQHQEGATMGLPEVQPGTKLELGGPLLTPVADVKAFPGL